MVAAGSLFGQPIKYCVKAIGGQFGKIKIIKQAVETGLVCTAGYIKAIADQTDLALLVAGQASPVCLGPVLIGNYQAGTLNKS